MRIVFCGTGWFPLVDVIRERLPAGASIRVRDPHRPVRDEICDAQVLLPSNCPLDAESIAAAPDLKLIQQPAVGVEGIDLQAAQARGIPVCNAPGTNGASMAEAALLLMLALARRLPQARHAFAAARIGVPVGVELRGKVLGIVGFGQSGSLLAEAARALGMDVLAVRSSSTAAERDDLFGRADFISLHCPLTPATRGLVSRAVLARTKRGACLINCSRGAIVDRQALEWALSEGHLGGVGLDTFWEEPWEPADPLYHRDDVVTLPHVGGSTREAFARIAAVVVDNVARRQRGEPLLHRLV